MIAKVNVVRELQSASGALASPPWGRRERGLSALMVSILDKAFKGEL